MQRTMLLRALTHFDMCPCMQQGGGSVVSNKRELAMLFAQA